MCQCFYFFFFFFSEKKAVHAATLKKWPANDIPIFRQNVQALKELNKLVEELEENCSFTQLGFDAQAIHQHILDILNE